MQSFMPAVRLSWIAALELIDASANQFIPANWKLKHVAMLECSGYYTLSLIINKIKTRVVVLTEIFKVIPFYVSYIYAFLPSFFAKFQRHYIQKPFLFLYLCTTHQIANVSGKEWAQLSLHHHRLNLFFHFSFPLGRGKKQADRNNGDKRETCEMKGSKESCPGSSNIHLVSDICFFIATWWHYSPLVLAGNHLFITWQLSL